MAGHADRALDLVDQAVDQGFYPWLFVAEYCPFLDPLRPMPRFGTIVGRARARAEAFSASEASGH
jgi:hypothetical protein